MRMNPRAMWIVVICLATIMPLSAPASGIINLSLKEIAKTADVIAVGSVEKKEAQWVGRRIETTVRIKAVEYWKGDLGDSFEITQLGGDMYYPIPVSMRCGGAPVFYEGERVVLFLQDPPPPKSNKDKSPDKAASRLWTSPMVVGWAQGKYTVLSDPATGKDKVLRLGMADARIVDRREMDRRLEIAAEYALKCSGGKQKAAAGLEKDPKTATRKISGSKGRMLKSRPLSPEKSASSGAFEISGETAKVLKLDKRPELSEFKDRVSEYLKP